MWEEEPASKGMMISRKKTEVMIVSKRREVLNIRLEDQDVKQPGQY